MKAEQGVCSSSRLSPEDKGTENTEDRLPPMSSDIQLDRKGRSDGVETVRMTPSPVSPTSPPNPKLVGLQPSRIRGQGSRHRSNRSATPIGAKIKPATARSSPRVQGKNVRPHASKELPQQDHAPSHDHEQRWARSMRPCAQPVLNRRIGENHPFGSSGC